MDSNISGTSAGDLGYTILNSSNTMQGNMSFSDPPTMGPLLYQYVYVTLLNCAVFIIGVLGNILVIQVVVRIRSMWKRMNFFLVSLSVADLQLLIVGLPVAVLEFYSKERWYIGETMCRLVPFFENASHHCSVMTLLVIGFERYYAICHPLRETARSRLTSPSLLIPTTWVLSCVVALPMAFTRRIVHATFYDGSQVDLCRIDGQLEFLRSYILFLFSVFLVLPLLLLTAMYTSIIVTLENSTRNHSMVSAAASITSASNSNNSKHGQYGSSSISSNDRRSRLDRLRSKDSTSNDSNQNIIRMIACRRQVIRMMIAVMVFYFLCLVPMRSFQIWTLLAPQEDINSLGLEGTLNLVYTVRMLIYLNCAANPIIYGLISANFRNAFKQSMSCVCGGRSNSRSSDGHRYNTVYYNNTTNKRRSANNIPEVIGTPTELSHCRRGQCNATKAVNNHHGTKDRGGDDYKGSRLSVDSKKSYNVNFRDEIVDVDKNGVMATQVVIDLYDKVYSQTPNRCINGNSKETKTFV